jgi:hypothetical protein
VRSCHWAGLGSAPGRADFCGWPRVRLWDSRRLRAAICAERLGAGPRVTQMPLQRSAARMSATYISFKTAHSPTARGMTLVRRRSSPNSRLDARRRPRNRPRGGPPRLADHDYRSPRCCRAAAVPKPSRRPEAGPTCTAPTVGERVLEPVIALPRHSEAPMFLDGAAFANPRDIRVSRSRAHRLHDPAADHSVLQGLIGNLLKCPVGRPSHEVRALWASNNLHAPTDTIPRA